MERPGRAKANAYPIPPAHGSQHIAGQQGEKILPPAILSLADVDATRVAEVCRARSDAPILRLQLECKLLCGLEV